MKKLLITALLLSGCSMDGTVQQVGLIDCKDLRDGETFTYDTATVHDVRIGIGSPTTMVFTDTDGRERFGSTDQTYLKCSKR